MKLFGHLIIILVIAVTAYSKDTAVKITSAEAVCALPAASNTSGAIKEFVLTFDQTFSSILKGAQAPPECSQASAMKTKRCVDAVANLGKVTKLIAILDDPANYQIVPLDSITTFSFVSLAPSPVSLGNVLIGKVTAGFDTTKNYVLLAKSLSTKGDPAMIKIDKAASCVANLKGKLAKKEERPTEPVEDVKQLAQKVLTKPANKDHPAIKFSFAASGAKNSKTAHSIQAEVRPITIRRIGYGGHVALTPFVLDTDVQFNQAKASNAKNILNIGIGEIDHIFVDDKKKQGCSLCFMGFNTVITPIKLETNWKFDEFRLIPTFRERFPINLFQTRQATLRIDPFVGFETGFIIVSEDNKKGFKIARPIFGSDLFLDVLRVDGKPGATLRVEYIQRTYLAPEVSFFVNDAGETKASLRTKRARGHAKAEITFNFGMFSPFISYEYGRLPPKYILQNGSFKTGIKFDLDFKIKRFQ